MKIFETRNNLLDKLPKNMVIAELGVFKGEFAKEIYTRTNPKHLYLVDIWEGEFGSGDKDGNNHTVIKDMKAVFENLCDEYKNKSNVSVVRQNTINFLTSQLDNSLDMVYVDADHSYESVTNDLCLSFSKLKNGGVLAGHDYIIGTQIAAAVNNFCTQYRQQIIALTKDGCPSFVIQVNKFS
jgi:hypothetical protein